MKLEAAPQSMVLTLKIKLRLLRMHAELSLTLKTKAAAADARSAADVVVVPPEGAYRNSLKWLRQEQRHRRCSGCSRSRAIVAIAAYSGCSRGCACAVVAIAAVAAAEAAPSSLKWLQLNLRRHRSRWSLVLTLKFDVARVAAAHADADTQVRCWMMLQTKQVRLRRGHCVAVTPSLKPR